MITTGKFDKVPAINAQIQKLKEEKYDEMIRPVAAFLTFRTQEGYERALKNWGEDSYGVFSEITENHKFNNIPIKVKAAPEPSNIIWEHRHITSAVQFRNKVLVSIGVLLILALALVLFSVAKIYVSKVQKAYPPTFDCADIDRQFAGDAELYKTYAGNDKAYTEKLQGTGIYQCYCKQHATFWSSDDLCDSWQRSFQKGTALSSAVSYGIVVFNIIIREVNIILIKTVGYHTESGQTSSIFIAIFVATFLNTGLLILLTGANTEQTFLSWLPLRGDYSDLDANWYLDIGPALIKTMLINSIYPYIDIAISYGMKLAFRAKDTCCCCLKRPTRLLTIQQYVNLYSGPQHLMHFKYAAILNTVWVTFMFGLALPMLFPIAAFTFFNYYLCEKFLLTYYYQKPPMYDEKLNNTALAWAKYAPLLMMVFGYWIMGNKQIFANLIIPLEYTSGTLTGHYGTPDVGQELPLFIVGWCLIAYFFIWNPLLFCCRKKGNCMKTDDDSVENENLGSYFECVSTKDKKCWLAEEVYNRNKLGIETMNDETLGKIQTIKSRKRTMTGTPNYEILSNSKYEAAFQFVPIALRNTEEEEYFSNLVTQIMYMGYIKPGTGQFDFTER